MVIGRAKKTTSHRKLSVGCKSSARPASVVVTLGRLLAMNNKPMQWDTRPYASRYDASAIVGIVSETPSLTADSPRIAAEPIETIVDGQATPVESNDHAETQQGQRNSE